MQTDDLKEPNYNCPTCRFDCPPEVRDKETWYQTGHCNHHEPRPGTVEDTLAKVKAGTDEFMKISKERRSHE